MPEGGGGGRGSEGVDNAPRAESSRHDGTICVPSGGWRYGGTAGGTTALKRYDGTTPVPSGDTTVPPLFILNNAWEDDRCTWCRYKGGTVVPRAGTKVVPLYLVQVQGWYRRTCSRCIIHSAPLNTSVLQFYQMTWGA